MKKRTPSRNKKATVSASHLKTLEGQRKAKAAFSDTGMITIAGRINPKTNDFSYQTWLKRIVARPAKDSEKLKALKIISCPDRVMQEIDKTFLAQAAEFQKSGYLTFEEWGLLLKAAKGDAASVRTLVHACPDILMVPCIARAVANILKDHRGKLQVKTITRKRWIDLLPSAKRLPFTGRELGRLIQVAEKEFYLYRRDAIAKVANDLGFNYDIIRKAARYGRKIKA